MSKLAGKTVAAALLSFALLGAACTKTQEYAATGGVLGAGAGAIVAGATGGNALAGAAVGGVAGAATGVILAQ
jgi:hypothetical protein